jgi:hypothetical protein
MGFRKILPLLALLAIVPFLAASCGSQNSNQSSTSTTKLPPGADSSATTDDSSGTATTQQSTTTTQSSTSSTGTSKMVSLGGVNLTVSKAARDDTNSVVKTSNAREISGDFLEIALTIENTSGALAPLSNYSFRLYSPGITASQYEDYYGSTGTYGAYVSSHVISASLLDYSSLSNVTYTLKKGEKIDEVFLFFDLNPQSTSQNTAVTKDNTNLIIYNTDSGAKVEVSLSGFSD